MSPEELIERRIHNLNNISSCYFYKNKITNCDEHVDTNASLSWYRILKMAGKIPFFKTSVTWK